MEHPEAQKNPIKTGRLDEGCHLDSPYLRGLEPLFEAIRRKDSTDPLWDFNYPTLAGALNAAAQDVGLGKVTLYQLRHSGASIDLAQRWHHLTEAQRRGPWPQAKLMHRYERSSRMGSDVGKLSGCQKEIFCSSIQPAADFKPRDNEFHEAFVEES